MHPRSSLPPGSWGRRDAVFAALLLLMLFSCARLPNAPEVRARAGGQGTARAAMDAAGDAIVRLKPGVSVDGLSASYGSVVLGSVPELDLVLLRLPAGLALDTFVRRLQEDPRIVFAEPNEAVENAEARQSTIAFSEATRTWSDVTDQSALIRVGAREAQAVARGAGVLVAILDTGIALGHPALVGVLDLPGIEPGVPTSPGNDRPEDVDTNRDGIVDGSLGHGTHVAGIVHAIAPAAQLLPVRVLDSDGVGDAFRVARGLVLAVGRGASVANLSLGMPGVSRAIQDAVDYARVAGTVVVAAAGNADTGQLDFPAAYAPVIAVAGTDPADRKATFSDYGAAVDVAAPAVGILSTYWDGTYSTWSGTSMAAPFASGIAALVYGILGTPTATNGAAVETLVRAGALPLAEIDPVYGSLLGAGRVSAAGSLRPFVSAGSGDESTTDPVLVRLGR